MSNFSGPNDPYRLYLTAPSGIVAGHTYQVTVNNGYSTVTADQTIVGHALGADHYGVLQPWGMEFIYLNGPNYHVGVAGTNENDHHAYNVTTDPALTIHAKPDGVTDATAAIQQAIDLAAAHGGGLVYFPSGTYRLASSSGWGLQLKSGVVLQGQGAATTKIVYGPSTPQGSSYMYFPFYWPDGAQLSGIADLSLQNIDKTSQVVVNAASGVSLSKIFLLRLNWDLGSGQSVSLQGDRIAVRNCTFQQAPNSQNPSSNGQSGVGPLSFVPASNFVFQGNVVSWASGQNSMNLLTNAVIESNHFTRVTDEMVATAQQTSWPYIGKPIAVGDVIERTPGRQLSVNTVKYVVIHSNVFDTSGDPSKYNWNDGETILSEGGGPFPRTDAGTVTSATTLTVADDSRCSGACTWNYYPNSIVSIVTGAGAGQIRHIVARNNNTFTIDQPWDITPSPGDRFAIDEPSLENALIRYNTMTGNPRGVVMYTGSFLNVSIIANALADNGGVWLRPDERPQNVNGSTFHFGRVRNIEINGNVLTNTKGLFDSYICVTFALISPNTFWGMSTDGVEIRNNRITGRPGTPIFDAADGYFNYIAYQDPNAAYLDQGTNAIEGTVFEGDSCTNCTTNYTLSTGALDTVIWNATTSNSAGVSSTLVTDSKIWNTAPHASTGTIVGHD